MLEKLHADRSREMVAHRDPAYSGNPGLHGCFYKQRLCEIYEAGHGSEVVCDTVGTYLISGDRTCILPWGV